MTKAADNPWGLTQSEAAVFDAMCEHGSTKRAARHLGLSTKTIEAHCSSGGSKMDAVGDRLRKFICWDRFRRGASST